MSPYERYLFAEDEVAPSSLRSAAAALLLIALFALFASVAPADRASLATRTPCAVLSEAQVSDVLGTTMRLMPTGGAVCHYVAATGDARPTLFVVARTDAGLPAPRGNDVALRGIGEGALLTSEALYVRTRGRSYKLLMAPHSGTDASISGQELRLAGMLGEPVIAKAR